MLEVKLENKSHYDSIEEYGLRLNYQPVLCFTVDEATSDNKIMNIIRDNQVRVEFRSSTDKDTALEQISRFGSVVDCID